MPRLEFDERSNAWYPTVKAKPTDWIPLDATQKMVDEGLYPEAVEPTMGELKAALLYLYDNGLFSEGIKHHREVIKSVLKERDAEWDAQE